ncbi:uncharacterized protein ABID14_001573 [Peptoniphilus olsenii]|uniref:HD domain-containing protein n=1 Tax=Peptoniphilus olsenii TaxID=411570 RepID=A0ABV2JAV1_9FIRM
MNNRNNVLEKLEFIINDLNTNTRFLENKNFIQHGQTSIYEHVIGVCLKSIEIAQILKLDVDYDSLIRGALLHDYFLYDWHNHDARHYLHGFFHPRIALENAKKELKLTKIEEDIILKHMFPLTVFPPRYKEAWVVTLADKIVAVTETFSRNSKKQLRVGVDL